MGDNYNEFIIDEILDNKLTETYQDEDSLLKSIYGDIYNGDISYNNYGPKWSTTTNKIEVLAGDENSPEVIVAVVDEECRNKLYKLIDSFDEAFLKANKNYSKYFIIPNITSIMEDVYDEAIEEIEGLGYSVSIINPNSHVKDAVVTWE